MRALGRLLFSFEVPVTRRVYLVTGVLLMLLKYAGDALIVHFATGELLLPRQYLSPFLMSRTGGEPWALPWVFTVALWTLPFLWVGVSMSVRRAHDAGWKAAFGLAFLMPYANYVVMLLLSLLPSRRREGSNFGVPEAEEVPAGVRSAVTATLLGLLVAVVVTGFSTLVWGEYGTTLFAVTPFLIGVVVGWTYNRSPRRSLRSTLGLCVLTVGLGAGALMTFALEGVVCLLMAVPLGVPLAAMGGALGQHLAGHQNRVGATFCLLLLPVAGTAELASDPTPQVREVRSYIDIDAAPAAVWDQLIAFEPIANPDEWFFKLGIAYPTHARIEGRGVGAVRYCEFSTGAFVEPITTWDEPRRLSFDVAQQPPAMTELNPHEHVYAPHLDGYLKSHRGEFRLHERPNGTTRLEGSTWYTVDMYPQWYWGGQADWLIGAIHDRVLSHIGETTQAN